MQSCALMNLDRYRQQLLTQERDLSERVDRALANSREPRDEMPRDVGDESMDDELESERFARAEADRAVLDEVRDALHRIDDGTFGTCVTGGEPIEEERLDAMPWTPYCRKHQGIRDASDLTRTPTL